MWAVLLLIQRKRLLALFAARVCYWVMISLLSWQDPRAF